MRGAGRRRHLHGGRRQRRSAGRERVPRERHGRGRVRLAVVRRARRAQLARQQRAAQVGERRRAVRQAPAPAAAALSSRAVGPLGALLRSARLWPLARAAARRHETCTPYRLPGMHRARRTTGDLMAPQRRRVTEPARRRSAACLAWPGRESPAPRLCAAAARLYVKSSEVSMTGWKSTRSARRSWCSACPTSTAPGAASSASSARCASARRSCTPCAAPAAVSEPVTWGTAPRLAPGGPAGAASELAMHPPLTRQGHRGRAWSWDALWSGEWVPVNGHARMQERRAAPQSPWRTAR